MKRATGFTLAALLTNECVTAVVEGDRYCTIARSVKGREFISAAAALHQPDPNLSASTKWQKIVASPAMTIDGNARSVRTTATSGSKVAIATGAGTEKGETPKGSRTSPETPAGRTAVTELSSCVARCLLQKYSLKKFYKPDSFQFPEMWRLHDDRRHDHNTNHHINVAVN